MNFSFLVLETIFYHLKIKFVSSRNHVISSTYMFLILTYGINLWKFEGQRYSPAGVKRASAEFAKINSATIALSKLPFILPIRLAHGL